MTALQFGIWDHFERRAGVPVSEQYEERIKLVIRAEELGLYGYHVAEHHLTPLDLTPSPNVFLAALAERTSRIRIGTMVLVLPLYNPVRLIQEICMVDQISRGRFMPSIGRGVRDIEHEWFKVNPLETRDRFEEIREILRIATDTGKLSFHGKYYDYDDIPLDVLPFQQPLPFWYAGNLEYAATHAMNGLGLPVGRDSVEAFWRVWNEARRRGSAAHLALEPLVGGTRWIYVAETDYEATAVASRAWDVLGDNFFTTDVRSHAIRDGKRIEKGTPGFGYGESADAATKLGMLVAGSPESVTKSLTDYLEQVGPKYNYLVSNFQWGDLSYEESLHSLELFASEVIPALTS